MSETTLLDAAHAAMSQAPEDDAARLRFYERLAASELFLMLEAEPDDDGDTVVPEVFDLQGGPVVLVFDREDRLAAFAGQVTPYVSLSGRSIAGMLAGQGIGLGVNLDVAPSSILLPPDAVSWLDGTLRNAPDTDEARIASLHAPAGLPEALISALDAKLASAMGLAAAAYLVRVTYDTGARGHLLAFVDAIPDAEPALAQAVAEALTFSGIEAGSLDVSFFRSSNPVMDKMGRVGLRFDLPQLQPSVTQARPAPGSDPAKPPKLK